MPKSDIFCLILYIMWAKITYNFRLTIYAVHINHVLIVYLLYVHYAQYYNIFPKLSIFRWYYFYFHSWYLSLEPGSVPCTCHLLAAWDAHSDDNQIPFLFKRYCRPPSVSCGYRSIRLPFLFYLLRVYPR